VVSLGARQYPLADALRFAEIFLSTDFTGEPRHVRRLSMLDEYERTGQLPPA
jgi:ribose 5-phosphate isomerase B